MTILQAGPTEKVLGTVDLRTPIYGSAIVANGAVYLQTQTHLWSFSKGGKPPRRKSSKRKGRRR